MTEPASSAASTSSLTRVARHDPELAGGLEKIQRLIRQIRDDYAGVSTGSGGRGSHAGLGAGPGIGGPNRQFRGSISASSQGEGLSCGRPAGTLHLPGGAGPREPGRTRQSGRRSFGPGPLSEPFRESGAPALGSVVGRRRLERQEPGPIRSHQRVSGHGPAWSRVHAAVLVSARFENRSLFGPRRVQRCGAGESVSPEGPGHVCLGRCRSQRRSSRPVPLVRPGDRRRAAAGAPGGPGSDSRVGAGGPDLRSGRRAREDLSRPGGERASRESRYGCGAAGAGGLAGAAPDSRSVVPAGGGDLHRHL